MSNVLEGIGNTPLVRINRIGESSGLKCEICKLNSNGSNSQRMNMLRSVCKFKLEYREEGIYVICGPRGRTASEGCINDIHPNFRGI